MNINQLMKQAQMLQDKVQKANEEILKQEATGESGAGLVKVVVTGRFEVKRVSIDDSLMKEDKEVLEDLIAAAMNDGVRKIEKMKEEKMAGVTGGLPLPPGMKLF
ncbi:MAG: YbaB/EbfC family nucleoid-associated protein [Gammaproteobacteria bacterium]